MLIFRLKPGVVCSPDATLLVSDVAYGLCGSEYEGVMSLPIHAPSRESYIIDALDVTRVIAKVYPDVRVEMRGMLMTRVCPIKVLHFTPNIPIPSRDVVPPREIVQPRVSVPAISLPDSPTVGHAPRATRSGRAGKYADASPSAYKTCRKDGFLSKVKEAALSFLAKGGFIVEKSYQQIPSYTLNQQPRPGDREERFKPNAQWDTRNKQEAGDNATKDT